MLEQFFFLDYADRGDLFQGLSIWKHEEYREIQGTYLVISLSFARIKETNYITAREKINAILTNLYIKFSFLKESIEEKEYEVALIARGIAKENIFKYGFAFEGKKVLIKYSISTFLLEKIVTIQP